MTLKPQIIAVGSQSPTQLSPSWYSPHDTSSRIFSVAITNTGTATIFVGDINVTATTGYPLDPGKTLTIDLEPVEILYGICASASSSTVAALTAGM